MMMERKLFRILVISLALVLLSSCNLMSKVSTPPPTPTLANIDVVVAQTLTALPTEENIIIIVPTETPAPLPTETPQPTATQQPTITVTASPAPPTDIITGEPGSHFLHIYFDEVIRGDYTAAWNNLTPAYRQNMHDNLLSDFTEGYEDMNLCDIEISDIEVVTDTSSYAKISAHYVYKIGNDCAGYPYDFDAHFNYNATLGRWLLDGLTEQD